MGLRLQLAKTTTLRRPDLVLEGKEKKKIWVCDMTCPQQVNMKLKRNEKHTKDLDMRHGLYLMLLEHSVEALKMYCKKSNMYLGNYQKQKQC